MKNVYLCPKTQQTILLINARWFSHPTPPSHPLTSACGSDSSKNRKRAMVGKWRSRAHATGNAGRVRARYSARIGSDAPVHPPPPQTRACSSAWQDRNNILDTASSLAGGRVEGHVEGLLTIDVRAGVFPRREGMCLEMCVWVWVG